uniref:Uncharacterized protein n=1 Tax=Meloidogyne enterolobii TaxID=390850 RepID=A0A6V7UVM7_MELEN|nr:unnamed protein product [Meloidogyne enterolobii]
MICNRLICFLLILSTVPAADTIKKYSKLQSIIEGKELINDMCPTKYYKTEQRQKNIGFKLCDFIIKNFVHFSVGLCEFTAAALAGTINCLSGWTPFATQIKKRCEADMNFWKEVWCLTSKPEQRECCFKNATSASQAILPSCKSFEETMLKLGRDICILSRNEGLSAANLGCEAAFSLLSEKPTALCYSIFDPSFVAEGKAF